MTKKNAYGTVNAYEQPSVLPFLAALVLHFRISQHRFFFWPCSFPVLFSDFPFTCFLFCLIFAMCFPNVLGLYILAPEVKADLKDYLKRVKSGEIKRFD